MRQDYCFTYLNDATNKLQCDRLYKYDIVIDMTRMLYVVNI